MIKHVCLLPALLFFCVVVFAQENTLPFDATTQLPMGVGFLNNDIVHARIESSNGPPPAGYLEINGATNSTVSIRAKRPILSGRLYAEIQSPATVGVAFSNPAAQPVTLTFYFTDKDGVDTAFGTTTLPANGQLARFLNESPFNAPTGLRGTFTFNASSPVGVLAVLGWVNEQGGFLIPQVPVNQMSEPGGTIIPYFGAGTGTPYAIADIATTDVLMVNMTNQTQSGAFTFLGQGTATSAAQPVALTINGLSGTSFRYQIPPRSSRRFAMSETGQPLIEGTIRITPDSGGEAPATFALVNLASGSVVELIRVTRLQNSVPAQRPSKDLRVFVQGGGFGGGHVNYFFRSSDVAVGNPSPTAVTVDLEMEASSKRATLVVPANGQVIYPVQEVAGSVYNGTLRISANAPILAIAFQHIPATIFTREPFEDVTPSPGDPELPHLPRIPGYFSQIIILRTSESQASSGVVRFFSQTGEPVAPR